MADYKAGKVSVWINAQRGVVCGQRQWSETSVSSSGRLSGELSPYEFKVSSETQRYHTFWVVSPDGEESEVTAPEGFSCREGQEVILFWGARKNFRTGNHLCIYNITTGKVGTYVAAGRIIWDPSTYFILQSIMYFFIICLIVFVWLFYKTPLNDNDSAGVVCAIAFCLVFGFIRTIYRMWKNRKLSYKVVNEALREEREKL